MKEQILALFEEGDRPLIAVDIAELSRIFADDYVQYNESGRAFSKQDLVNNLRSSAIPYIAMRSTGRRIRLVGEDVAIVHSSEEDEIEQGGKRSLIR
ncbi:MAG TPA: nuclear transport factor 2 family protein [Candidatus Acidoferrum sp.]|nr:nuclear transport factor 2 family protein [Candidatus Acidoferrum sp.]